MHGNAIAYATRQFARRRFRVKHRKRKSSRRVKLLLASRLQWVAFERFVIDDIASEVKRQMAIRDNPTCGQIADLFEALGETLT